jgi:hypothetical protein
MHRVELVASAFTVERKIASGTKSSIGSTLSTASSTGYDAMAVQPDQPPRVLDAGIVAVDDGDFVAVTHGAQCRKQLRAQQRIKSLQHSRPP